MPMYTDKYEENWTKYFNNLSNEMKERTVKKIKKILEYPKKRHLGGKAKFFVDEIGQNRIVYMVFEKEQQVWFYFVGDHKEYEKWYEKYF